MLLAVNVAIGLVLTFSLVSLLASLLNEWVSGILKMRGQMLWTSIDDLLGKELSERLGEHPFLKGLRQRSWLDKLAFWKKQKDSHRHKIAYLPTDIFVRAVLATLDDGPQGPAPAGEEAAEKKPPKRPPAQILPALVKEAKGDVDELKKNLGKTFDTAMNEVSSWYKRWSQVALFVLGLGIAFFVGVDAVVVTERLATDPELREAVAAQAEGVLETYYPTRDDASDPPPPPSSGSEGDPEAKSKQVKTEIRTLLATIEGTGLPLIEPPACPPGKDDCATWERQWGGHWKDHWPGFLLTALACCFGAPFWFDLLKRLINLRVSLKPPELTDQTNP